MAGRRGGGLRGLKGDEESGGGEERWREMEQRSEETPGSPAGGAVGGRGGRWAGASMLVRTHSARCHVPTASISLFCCSKPPFSTDPFTHNGRPVATHTQIQSHSSTAFFSSAHWFSLSLFALYPTRHPL